MFFVGQPPPVSIYTNDLHWCHIPISLQYCGSCPCKRHNPYLPSISASLQTLGRAKRATIPVIAPLDSRIITSQFYLKLSQRPLEVQNFDSERFSPIFPSSLGSCSDTQAKTLASPPSSLSYRLLNVCQTHKSFFFFFPRVCQTLRSHYPPRLLEIRVCQTLKKTLLQSILQCGP